MHKNEIAITPVRVDDWRADHSGILIEQIAKLAFERGFPRAALKRRSSSFPAAFRPERGFDAQ
ncbi:hypothetical protein ANRL3_01180 [Anaerolineae bacterium]|nr:hypothetical protein ANRL3_01180 [Anaerolineae bacterium]